MAYEPTNWARGDVVTSEKLNKIEHGIAGGGILLVNLSREFGENEEEIVTSDKTWQQIRSAAFPIFVMSAQGYGNVPDTIFLYPSMIESQQAQAGDTYSVFVDSEKTYKNYELKTDSPDGYPSYTSDGGGGPK